MFRGKPGDDGRPDVVSLWNCQQFSTGEDLSSILPRKLNAPLVLPYSLLVDHRTHEHILVPRVSHFEPVDLALENLEEIDLDASLNVDPGCCAALLASVAVGRP